MRPIARKVHDLMLRCTTCTKTKRVKGVTCPECGPKADAYTKARREEHARWTLASTVEERHAITDAAVPIYEPGCENCFKGLTLPDWVKPCCCFQKVRPCDGCADVSDRLLPHVCTVDTAAEQDFELTVALTSTRGHTTDVDAQKTAAKHGLHDEGQGFRAPKY